MTTKTAIALEEISEVFVNLAGKVKFSNKVKRTNINTDSERFFIRILNKVYNLNLSNLNDEISNYPAIDLSDVAEGVCIQVTSTSTSKKFKETISKFKSHNLDEDYNKIIFLILSWTEKCKCNDDEKEIDTEVINLIDLYVKISQMKNDADIRELHRYITNEYVQKKTPPLKVPSDQNEQSFNLDSIQRLIDHFSFENDKECREMLERDIEAFAEKLSSLNPKQREIIYLFVKKSNFIKNIYGKINNYNDIYMSSNSAGVEFDRGQNSTLDSLRERDLLEIDRNYELQDEEITIVALFLRFRGELDATNLFGQLKHFCKGKDKRLREIFLHCDFACLAL